MLQNTFLHVPGIAKTTESRLWKEGCACWDDFLNDPMRWSLGSASKSGTKRFIERSRKALEEREHQFFRRGLGMRQAWRAFPEFRHSCAYLDIETDGGGAGAIVTMIGLYDGKDYRCLMHGDNIESFRDAISHYSMIVTFFGASFDLPVLQQRFPGLVFDQIHIDLCPTLAQVGYRGGLKKIERQLGIERSPEAAGLTGRDAIFLWKRYRSQRDKRALDRLIKYNREDCVNLEKLSEQAYRQLKRLTFDCAVDDRQYATLLLTEIFEADSHRQRLGEEAWEELRQRHNRVLSQTLRSANGRLVKSTGFGMFASFESSEEALACARECMSGVRCLELELRCAVLQTDLKQKNAMALHHTIASQMMQGGKPGQIVTR